MFLCIKSPHVGISTVLCFQSAFLKEQGQKLVLSDALAVQSRGPKVLSPKLVFGSQQMFWDLKECFGISKMYWQLESQKKLTLLKLFTQLSLLKLLLILLKQSETIPSSN